MILIKMGNQLTFDVDYSVFSNEGSNLQFQNAQYGEILGPFKPKFNYNKKPTDALINVVAQN